jgi:hypothetical protein
MYVAHAEGDMCHDDVNMVMWQAPEAATCHSFLAFLGQSVDQ